jgi:hypothetical protein
MREAARLTPCTVLSCEGKGTIFETMCLQNWKHLQSV